jgi:Na+-transporting NADH:ubiquinone oxidoreductase subunit NqrB
MKDVRNWQIAAQIILLVYGVQHIEFQWNFNVGIIMLIVGLLTQFCFDKGLLKKPVFNWKSAIATGLSLNLILRTQSITGAILISFLAIASKYLFRWNEKHIFNPSNLAIIVALLLGDGFWVSPGQWGSIGLFMLFVFGLGIGIISKSDRFDISISFILIYAGLVFARALWLGDPLAVPIHHLQSGTLWIFTFFMISDPRTTPCSAKGRFILAAMVALIAFVIHFQMYRYNGPLWGLAIGSLMVPFLDRIFPDIKFQWLQGEAHDIQKLQTT